MNDHKLWIKQKMKKGKQALNSCVPFLINVKYFYCNFIYLNDSDHFANLFKHKIQHFKYFFEHSFYSF